MLLDRKHERESLERLLATVHDGLSGALVLRGEPGIGKTALVDPAVACAGDIQVARVEGVQSEMELGFAALHRLLIPFLARLKRLPTPQRDALNAAFGRIAGGPPDAFLVRLATLTLLVDVASEAPLLCVVDDAQWLDDASAAVLAFVARRLVADRIGLLVAVRDPCERRISFDGLTELPLGGLPTSDAHELLVSASGVHVDPGVSEQIVSATGGNPLALAELGSELTPDELTGASPLPEPLPLGRRLAERLAQRLGALGADVQTLLLLAAADPSGDPALLWRAGGALGLGPEAADHPEVDRMLTLTPRVTFRHPLMRSAIYHRATTLARHRAHQALAAASDPELDPDLRAWHLAAAVDGPDEQVAAELERSAPRACARGGWRAAAASLILAAALTPDENHRAVRRLRAADAELAAGASASAAALLEQAEPFLADPMARAEARRLRAWVRCAGGGGAIASARLLKVALALRPLDAGRARGLLLEALEAALCSGAGSGGAVMREIGRVTRSTPRPPHRPETPGDLLLDGFALLDTDDAAGVTMLRRAVQTLREEDSQHEEYLRWMSLACVAAYELWDSEAMQALCGRAVQRARAEGAMAALARLLHHQALLHRQCGRPAAAEAARGEAQALCASSRCVGIVGSDDGNLDRANLPGVIETAMDRGDRDAATKALARLTARATVSGTALGLGLLARSRALLADGDTAERLYAEAITHLERCRAPGELARARLLFGEWLRGQRRWRSARSQLRAADELLRSIGADTQPPGAHARRLPTGN